MLPWPLRPRFYPESTCSDIVPCSSPLMLGVGCLCFTTLTEQQGAARAAITVLLLITQEHVTEGAGDSLACLELAKLNHASTTRFNSPTSWTLRWGKNQEVKKVTKLAGIFSFVPQLMLSPK